MLIKHQLSNSTWGRVLSLRDDQTNEVAPRPIAGRTKTLTHTEEVTIEVSPTDPQAAKDFAPMTLRLGSKTWSRSIPDVDPLWQEWLDADRITEELLADVAEPEADILARAKAAKIAAIDQWLTEQDTAGIDVGGYTLKSNANAATQLQVYLSTLTPGVDTILVSDVQGTPHIVAWEALGELSTTFKSEFNRRRGAWATAKVLAAQAKTLEELDAVELPR